MRRQYPVGILAIAVVFLFSILPAVSWAEIKGYEKSTGYEYIALGVYPQTEQGEQQPIIWRVLEVTDEYAYLLCEYILFNYRVHEDYKEYEQIREAFHQTEIFSILNGEFLDSAFSPAESALLIEDQALGKIFLVDADDIKNKEYGFTDNKSRQGFGTPFAVANGLFKYRNTAHGRGSSPYWTRSPSSTLLSGVRCTKADGSIGYIRCVVMNEGIRPALRLSLTAKFYGAGTMTDPYRIVP
jgi:hypothetical protein